MTDDKAARTSAQIEIARHMARMGRNDLALTYYLNALGITPHQLEALDFVVAQSIGRGQLQQAGALLEYAAASDPASNDIARGLGLVCEQLGRLDDAARAFADAARLDPRDYLSRMMLGRVLERKGEAHGALSNYFAAIVTAQSGGVWLSDETTEPGQLDQVRHALQYVAAGRQTLFDAVIAPVRKRHGATSLSRIEQALAIYLKSVDANYADPRQQPGFIYVPGLPTQAYFGRDQFDWVEPLESRTADIRQELESVMRAGATIEPFHGQIAPEQLGAHLRSDRGTPAWNSHFFYRHGERFDENCRLCPRTMAALDKVPLVQIRAHAPECLFSILAPGTHILPHRGVTNSRLVAHLPLIVPNDCAIVVGGETHVWREGEVVIFDDTFEHEAWNRSTRDRAVLIMDVWNPYLDEAERDALTHLVPAIGDFNRACGL